MYRIFLSRNIGSEGLGLYQIALSVIGVIITLSASGIPITVSRLMVKERTAKRYGEENKTVSAGIFTALAVSGVICACLFIFQDFFSTLFADKRTYTLFLIMLPGVVLTSVYAVIRGFLWGTKSFFTYSAIELLEEIVMIAVGVFTIINVNSVMEKSICASVAVLISYVFSFAFASIVFIIKGGKIKNPISQLKPMLSSSAPITVMRASSSLTSSLIALILPAVLVKGGMDVSQAISEYGIISGMTLPLFFIPSTIIGSISLVLTPELAESYYKKNTVKLQEEVEKSTLSAIIIAVLIMPLFIGMGEFLGEFIYDNTLSGIYLRAATPAMLPMSICMITGSLLNSIGMEKRTLLHHLAGSMLLILCVTFLPQKIGNYALIIGYFSNFTITAVLNVLLLKKICCKQLRFIKKTFTCVPIVLFLSLLTYFSFELLSKFVSELLSALICTIVTLACNATCLVIFKIVSQNDLDNFKISLPKFKNRRKKTNKYPLA